MRMFKFALGVLVSLGTLISTAAFAQAGSGSSADIGSIATQITSTFSNVGQLMAATAYLAGFGLTIAAIFKFKQHKDNPTQIPLGTPIALLLVGVSLIFLPSLVNIGGTTIFGTAEKTAGGFTGKGALNLPGEK